MHPFTQGLQRFREMDVPAVLLSGDHAAIDAWREKEREQKTRSRRPDLLEDRDQHQ